MNEVYAYGDFSVVRIPGSRIYKLWRWLGMGEGWQYFGKYRSKSAAIREIESMMVEG